MNSKSNLSIKDRINVKMGLSEIALKFAKQI